MTTKTNPTTPDLLVRLLDEHGAMTVGRLAELAVMGRSTVGKALAVLESQGRATRQVGQRHGARRSPDAWSGVRASLPAAPSAVRNEPGPRPRKLGKGELRSLVLAHLQEHNGEVFTPTALGKRLRRSSGAINNALVRLVDDGAVTQIGDKPRTYAVTD